MLAMEMQVTVEYRWFWIVNWRLMGRKEARRVSKDIYVILVMLLNNFMVVKP